MLNLKIKHSLRNVDTLAELNLSDMLFAYKRYTTSSTTSNRVNKSKPNPNKRKPTWSRVPALVRIIILEPS